MVGFAGETWKGPRLLFVELWEDLHGPKRLVDVDPVQGPPLPAQHNLRVRISVGEIDQKGSKIKQKSACHQRSVNRRHCPSIKLDEIVVWSSLGMDSGNVQRCTASGPSQTCASGRRLMREANPCLAFLGCSAAPPESWVPVLGRLLARFVTCRIAVLRQHPTLRLGFPLPPSRYQFTTAPLSHRLVSRSFEFIVFIASFLGRRLHSCRSPGCNAARLPLVGCLASRALCKLCPRLPATVDTRTPQLLDVFQPALCRRNSNPNPLVPSSPPLATATRRVGRETYSFNHCALPIT
jgi:hypothetical protein